MKARSLVTFFVATVSILGLIGCETRVANRGHMPDTQEIAEIQPGKDTAQDILRRFGTPSSTAVFRNDTWYYIGQRMETTAFYAPEIVRRGVLVVNFDETGVVKDTQYLTMEDGQQVELVQRVTPTEGREFTVLEQLLGNFGRLPDSFGGGNPASDRVF